MIIENIKQFLQKISFGPSSLPMKRRACGTRQIKNMRSYLITVYHKKLSTPGTPHRQEGTITLFFSYKPKAK